MATQNKHKIETPKIGAEDRYIKYVPRTEFGRRLLELRHAIEQSGEKMLTEEEVWQEVRERRGGID